MNRSIIVTGICAAILVAVLLAAGCTSSPAGTPAAGTGGTPQVTSTATATPAEVTPAAVPTTVPGQSDQLAATGSDDLSQSTIDADAAVDPYNSTSQATTMVPDSQDLGDAIP